MLGKLFSLPVKILNIPLRAIEKVVDSVRGDETPKEDRVLSKPFEKLSEAIEEIDEEGK